MKLTLIYDSADLSSHEVGVKMPAGYIVASVAEYPEGKSPIDGRDLGYDVAVQILNQTSATMGRGTGNTVKEALERAIEFVKTRGF